MSFQHKELANGRWEKLSLIEQLANVGSDVLRAISWKNKGDKEQAQAAFYRSLELIDLTIRDKKNIHRLYEVIRMREVWASYFTNEEKYGYTEKAWEQYFNNFAYAANLKRGL